MPSLQEREGLLINKNHSQSLVQNGFMPNYNVWTEHSERGSMLENEEEEEESIPNFGDDYGAIFEDTTMGEPEEDAEAHVAEDDLGRILHEAAEVCETKKESSDLKCMLEDYRILLCPDCNQGHKKMGTTLELLQWKASNGLSDRGLRSC
jgi:hypothetical protein